MFTYNQFAQSVMSTLCLIHICIYLITTDPLSVKEQYSHFPQACGYYIKPVNTNELPVVA